MEAFAGPQVHGDQVGAAIHAARERLGESGQLYSALAEHDDAEVRESVALSLEYTGEHEPGTPGSVLAAYAAETVAFGALSRAATGEPPLNEDEVKSIGDFLRRIFNGLFDR